MTHFTITVHTNPTFTDQHHVYSEAVSKAQEAAVWHPAVLVTIEQGTHRIAAYRLANGKLHTIENREAA